MSGITAALLISNGNVTHVVEGLVADGMAERKGTGSDRRMVVVRLTRRGLEEFSSLASAHEIWVNEILAHLDDTDFKKLLTLLKKANPNWVMA